jgi:hypothetical protein
MLIGADHPEVLMPLEVRKGQEGPYAVRSVLGWTLNGPISEGSPTKLSCNFVQSKPSLEVKLEAQWRHLNTKLNPADDCSRRLNVEELLSRRWKDGPEFLWEKETLCPEEKKLPVSFSLNDRDVEEQSVAKTCDIVKDPEEPVDKFLKKYSSWHKLKKAVAWLLRFKQWLKSGKEECEEKELRVEDLAAAETAIVAYLQKSAYSKEIKALQKGKRLSRENVSIALIHNWTVMETCV